MSSKWIRAEAIKPTSTLRSSLAVETYAIFCFIPEVRVSYKCPYYTSHKGTSELTNMNNFGALIEPLVSWLLSNN